MEARGNSRVCDPDRVSHLIGATASYLRTYYGDNDGLLHVNDQSIAGTGRIIATLDADHFVLTVARPVSADSRGPAAHSRAPV